MSEQQSASERIDLLNQAIVMAMTYPPETLRELQDEPDAVRRYRIIKKARKKLESMAMNDSAHAKATWHSAEKSFAQLTAYRNAGPATHIALELDVIAERVKLNTTKPSDNQFLNDLFAVCPGLGVVAEFYKGDIIKACTVAAYCIRKSEERDRTRAAIVTTRQEGGR